MTCQDASPDTGADASADPAEPIQPVADVESIPPSQPQAALGLASPGIEAVAQREARIAELRRGCGKCTFIYHI